MRSPALDCCSGRIISAKINDILLEVFYGMDN